MDTGTPENYLQLHRDLLSGKYDGYELENDVSIGKGSKIHPTVKFKGKVIIGANCVITSGVKLTGPVVLGPNCKIGKILRLRTPSSGTILQSVRAWL